MNDNFALILKFFGMMKPNIKFLQYVTPYSQLHITTYNICFAALGLLHSGHQLLVVHDLNLKQRTVKNAKASSYGEFTSSEII